LNKIKYLIILFWAVAYTAAAQNPEMVRIKSGSYIPLYGADSSRVKVKDFLIDTIPVTKAEYKEFLRQNPQWQRSNIKGIFSKKTYLHDWKGDLEYDEGRDLEPVVNVSWFAAKEYCRFIGKRLPSVDEWEYVAMADQRDKDAREKETFNQYILSWYEKPKQSGQKVGSTFKNYWGVYDMHGLVWEWTSDFNSVMIASESRSSGNNTNLFCSAAAIGATDLMNYAAFMRYAYRSSVKASFTGNYLGFRCAKDI